MNASAKAPITKNPTPLDRYVGSRVRMRRMIVGISQGKLGEALGITFQQVHKYEKGTNRIGAGRLQLIALVLGVPIEFFFKGVPHASRRGAFASDAGLGHATSILSTSEGVQLMHTFMRVADPKIRRRFLSFVKAMAESNSV